ncbi:carbohydrate porin [Vibrio artabrorum]|uniref:Carbohydrate porin n=1 Tax=Vibrio artabrorum TaxID=446374 RepID=A0ABT8CLJ1_9VIBR|nr:carbohydrate porin [Vibrio artabrorum]MDN3702289.1 carbohydrate porin [Vibrio artabrorum]
MKAVKLSLLTSSIILASSSYAAGTTLDYAKGGQVTFSGDVELNFNARKTDTENGLKVTDPGTSFNQDGRISFAVEGEKTLGSNTLSFKFNPTYNTEGEVGVDDVWLNLSRNNTDFKVGRFEAADLFPKGQDIFVNNAGDAADNSILTPNFYLYEMKEGRGRAKEAGQIMITQYFENITVEVSTVFGKRSDIADITKTTIDDSLYVRPVVTYTNEGFTISGGMEAQVLSDTIVVNGKDIGKRIGFGVTTGYSTDNFSVLANYAQMNAEDETDRSIGVNTTVYGFGLGYIKGINDVNKNGILNRPSGSLDTFYTSYEFKQVLGFDNFDTYLGAYYSQYSQNDTEKSANDLGTRLRLKYYF